MRAGLCIPARQGCLQHTFAAVGQRSRANEVFCFGSDRRSGKIFCLNMWLYSDLLVVDLDCKLATPKKHRPKAWCKCTSLDGVLHFSGDRVLATCVQHSDETYPCRSLSMLDLSIRAYSPSGILYCTLITLSNTIVNLRRSLASSGLSNGYSQNSITCREASRS